MGETREIKVPDIGDFDAVDVIEILVSPGDRVEVEDGLISLESDKASMDVPSPVAGTVKEIKVSAGDQVSQGDVIALVEVEGDEEPKSEEPAEEAGEPEKAETPKAGKEKEPALEPEPDADEAAPAAEEAPAPRSTPARQEESKPSAPRPERHALDEAAADTSFDDVYASPSIRRFGRELGVDLTKVRGSGRNGRILREDVQEYVKRRLAGPAGGASIPAGAGVELPEIDFSQWGEVEVEELTRVQRLTGENTHRSWITIPHVTQHDEADVTELEEFRKELSKEAEAKGVKLTPIPFLVKAVAAALRELPRFNASLTPDGASIVLKKNVHVGIAVDTGGGLVVPVIRNADQKGLFELAGEVIDLASRARDRKLKMEEMRGGTFTISSLGGIGGTAFTPIVNWPEVAILGVSKNAWKPVWNGSELVPRLMMPLSLSYDHRAIDGAAAARFTRYLAEVLGDLRRLLL
jgi:pyruvate dehydrogenase E2 component (dihydrolipoamide acetyltransferase)